MLADLDLLLTAVFLHRRRSPARKGEERPPNPDRR
jgi:hypothetical protein